MFGMGTGGSLRLLSPEILCFVSRSHWRFAPRSLSLSFFACSSLSHLQNRTGSVIDLGADFCQSSPCSRFACSASVAFASSLAFRLACARFTASSDQALDRLVSSTFIPYGTPSDDLSTSSSLRGLTCLLQWQSSSSGGLHA